MRDHRPGRHDEPGARSPPSRTRPTRATPRLGRSRPGHGPGRRRPRTVGSGGAPRRAQSRPAPRARPSEILALTFTDKAAEEMAVRVDQLVPYGYTDAEISTFHAFGDGLIREYALELGLPTDVRVLSRPEVVIFLREHLFEFELDAYRPL
ncbi:MAG: UvrD-helicase domain-containing protein, partial [Chloroflexi bacterium]|nr:UvrD-helicase domain-containing protein [Chloroflexota bacterium]